MPTWTERLTELCGRIRVEVRAGLAEARPGRVERPVRQGVGDVTYGIDAVSERVIDAWLEQVGAEQPLSLLTEDAGWRHAGPGSPTGFDHGGPRIAIDPVDGTRNLMADLRSAWTVVSLAGPGTGQPRLSDQTLGLVSEIPDTRGGRYRVLRAQAGGPCSLALHELGDDTLVAESELVADDDARADHGYFPFFRYAPELRPALAAIEAEFFRRLGEHEGAETRHCFDDQYICGAGQAVLLALGTYRSMVDVRGWVAERAGLTTTTGHPYDVAGAIVCARAAGCEFTDAEGRELDFPIDCETPVNLVGWTNAATRRRLWPHLRAAFESTARARHETERA